MPTWEDLTPAQQAPYLELAETALDDLLYCTRTWESWRYGAMSAADFSPAVENADIVADVAETLYNGVAALAEATCGGVVC